MAISEFASTLHASGLQILSNQSRSAAGSNRVEEKMEQEGKENSGSSCGEGIEERGDADRAQQWRPDQMLAVCLHPALF